MAFDIDAKMESFQRKDSSFEGVRYATLGNGTRYDPNKLKARQVDEGIGVRSGGQPQNALFGSTLREPDEMGAISDWEYIMDKGAPGFSWEISGDANVLDVPDKKAYEKAAIQYSSDDDTSTSLDPDKLAKDFQAMYISPEAASEISTEGENRVVELAKLIHYLKKNGLYPRTEGDEMLFKMYEDLPQMSEMEARMLMDKLSKKPVEYPIFDVEQMIAFDPDSVKNTKPILRSDIDGLIASRQTDTDPSFIKSETNPHIMAFDIDTRMDQWTQANRAEHSEDIEPILKSSDKKKEEKKDTEEKKTSGESEEGAPAEKAPEEDPVAGEEISPTPVTIDDIIAMLLPDVAAGAAVTEGEPVKEAQAPPAPVDDVAGADDSIVGEDF